MRCCNGDQPKASYASVCLLGKKELDSELKKMEEDIHPSFTAWCSVCKKVSTLTTDMDKFHSPSEYYTHMLRLHQNFQSYF